MSEQKMPALPSPEYYGLLHGEPYWSRATVERIQREAYEAGRQQERSAIFSGKYHEPLTLLDPVHNQCYSAGWEAAMIDCKRAERERMEPLRLAMDGYRDDPSYYWRKLVLEAARTLLEQTE